MLPTSTHTLAGEAAGRRRDGWLLVATMSNREVSMLSLKGASEESGVW